MSRTRRRSSVFQPQTFPSRGGDLPNLEFKTEHVYASAAVGIEVPISIKIGGPPIPLRAKIDTGAAFCIFEKGYADALEIDLGQCPIETLATAGGKIEVRKCTVTVTCFDWQFDASVGFYVDDGPRRNVLGRVGWLDHFRVAIIDNECRLFLSHFDD
jgi:hypothetical protein